MLPEIKLFTPGKWSDYELIDCGTSEKLERFGNIILRRPEPQSLWPKALPPSEWNNADVTFNQIGSHHGEWKKRGKVPDKWKISYSYGSINLSFKLSLTSFKHIGIFPEQSGNWNYIIDKIRNCKSPNPKVLNLFAYTGGASLAAKAAGADVTHVDSVKQIISWSHENMESSGLTDIRWVVEDAMKFVKRELKRGHKYTGIILDPPAYGIGANGERWKLEDCIDELISNISGILTQDEYFLILNMYSLGFSSLIAENLIRSHFPHAENVESGEVCVLAKSGITLPLGIVTRFSNL